MRFNKDLFLSVVLLFERFSYHWLSLVVVFLAIYKADIPDADAYVLWARYCAVCYIIPLVSGLLSDRVIGSRFFITLGCILMTVGYGVMALYALHGAYLFFGLACVAVGVGVFKPALLTCVSLSYIKNNSDRSKAFILLYSLGNLGTFFAYTFCERIFTSYGVSVCFCMSCIGAFISLLLWIKGKKYIKDVGFLPNSGTVCENVMGWKAKNYVLLITAFLIILSTAVFSLGKFSPSIIVFIGIAVFVSLMLCIVRVSKHEVLRLMIIVFILVFFTAFFALELQTFSTIALFFESNVNKTFCDWTVSASMLRSIPIISIVIVGLIRASLMKNKSYKPCEALFSIAFGVFGSAVSFFVFYLGCRLSIDGMVNVLFPIFGLVILGISEAYLATTVINYVSLLAPYHMKSYVISVMMLCIAFASTFSVFIEKIWFTVDNSITDKLYAVSLYQAGFINVAIVQIIASGIFFVLCFLFLKHISGIVESIKLDK
ncbi:POT-type proton-dependent oligopeptide transporter [Candidatus Sneabacter namystus]|uniref:Peptide MFS transporter n=1 Tax=Candidatus Sneabacter namystus TaxID=2601646 RepID=A0A5C0UH79_9RICK|nr:MFS transporter [Candidatus Sneabacter namystus]QEK39468.1 peptide MFS transporter [Candidatus Sneabacter namystus]